MKTLKEYLVNESFGTINSWRDLEKLLPDFTEETNIEMDNAEDNDIDDILSSLEEYMIEIWDMNENSVKRAMSKYDSDLRKWFFDNGYVESA